MVVGEHRTAIHTRIDGDRIFVHQAVIDLCQEREQGIVHIAASGGAILPHAACRKVVVGHRVMAQSTDCRIEGRGGVRLIFGHLFRGKVMDAPIMCPVDSDIAQPGFGLGLGAIGLSVCPDPGGLELRVLRRDKRIGTEGRHIPILADAVVELDVRIEVQDLVLVLLDNQRQRIVDLRGIDVTVPSSAGIRAVGVGRVLCGSRIEEFLFVEDVVVALAAAHHAEVDGQNVVEGLLRHVELGCEIAVAVVRDHRVLSHVGKRGAIVLLVAAAAECDVMILCKTRTSQGTLEVGVVAAIHIGLVKLSCRSHILVGIEHVELLVGCFETDVAVVRDMELRTLSLLGGHHNHTRSTLRAVGRCLGCILEDGEALDVGRIDTRKG